MADETLKKFEFTRDVNDPGAAILNAGGSASFHLDAEYVTLEDLEHITAFVQDVIDATEATPEPDTVISPDDTDGLASYGGALEQSAMMVTPEDGD